MGVACKCFPGEFKLELFFGCYLALGAFCPN